LGRLRGPPPKTRLLLETGPSIDELKRAACLLRKDGRLTPTLRSPDNSTRSTT
jgi:hypothetical protein